MNRTASGKQYMALAIASLFTMCLQLPKTVHGQAPSGLELIGRGVNYGNMLESPREGEWGVRFDDRFPQLVKEAGFDSVRVPVRWSSHQATAPPYQIDSAFLARVRHVVDRNLDAGLKVVLNVHHFDELYETPKSQRERFLELWQQLSNAFAGYDERLFFEILNEPHGNLNADQWNPLLVDTLAVIRPQHPDRWVVIGGDNWNGIEGLDHLSLPVNDRRLVVTVHYYLPFAFTHQGAGWVNPILPTGLKWTGTTEEREAIDRDLQRIDQWAREHRRPVYLGEFGAYERADLASRARWTQYVRQRCEGLQFGWGYWELAAGFAILDKDTYRWNQSLIEALIPR